jgi:hypothetical protein
MPVIWLSISSIAACVRVRDARVASRPSRARVALAGVERAQLGDEPFGGPDLVREVARREIPVEGRHLARPGLEREPLAVQHDEAPTEDAVDDHVGMHDADVAVDGEVARAGGKDGGDEHVRTSSAARIARVGKSARRPDPTSSAGWTQRAPAAHGRRRSPTSSTARTSGPRDGTIRSERNIFGGQTYRLPDGGRVESVPNIFGGRDLRYPDGHTVTCQPNIFGGEDCAGNPDLFGVAARGRYAFCSQTAAVREGETALPAR